MGYWKKSSRTGGFFGSKPVVQQEKASGKLLGFAPVRSLIQESLVDVGGDEFYELELAEVMEVILTEDQLPELEDGSGKDWNAMGGVLARGFDSQQGQPYDTIKPIFPLDPNNSTVPIRGETVVLVNYLTQGFYISLVNWFNSSNVNLAPGLSGARDEDVKEQHFKYEHFDIKDYENIRRIWPYQGDNIYQGRWGQSIRFGSNIIPDSHEDGDSTQHSPNIIIRAGQLLDADAFDKGGIVEDLKNDTTLKKTVKEDINADGSSLWMTTDQSVKLDIEGSNAVSHVFMTSKQSDDQPKNGGKQIVINSDRITFNTKQGKILGFSHDGIGFSTQKSFSVDADDGMKMNSGGATSMDMVPGGISLITPGNSRLDLGGGGGDGEADKIYLSSECPSFLTLDDKAHLQSCEGAVVHLDDCAGMKDNQGSFIRIGGKAQGITGYVKGRDDMKQQHLVYGEALTDILDELITSILNITAIPTGAGPSGPISATPSLADFESVRAKLCDLLMKPE